MLRKLFLFVLAVMLMQSITTAKYAPSRFLFGDENYIYCTGHTGVLFYADKSSINVMEYMISVDVVAVSDMCKSSRIDLEPDRTKISEPKTYTFL